jgi:xylitol oxidase
MAASSTATHGGTARTNWAGNVVYAARRHHRPGSVAQLQQLVARADRIRALGTGHSFNAIADSPGELVSVDGLPPAMDVDTVRHRVEVAAGVRFGELGGELQRQGLALPNTGSLPHISVAGACATGTHGSGLANQTLGAGVRALTLVTAEGDLRTFDRDVDDDFDGVVLSLGRLGVVVSMVLDVVPTYSVAQTVVDAVDDAALGEGLADILAAAYSVSVFTDWGPRWLNRVWMKERVDRPGAWDGSRLWGGRVAEVEHHPISGLAADTTTRQLGVPGPWNERLPHFRLEFVPSSGDELQSEYLLPVEHASAAWHALSEIREQLHPAVQVCEIRSLAPDPMWLSLTGGAPSVAFHFTWVSDAAAVAPRVATVEERLQPFGARPHWAKVFTTPPATLARLYPRLPDFRRLVTDLDPAGKLGNALVDGWIGLEQSGPGGDPATAARPWTPTG